MTTPDPFPFATVEDLRARWRAMPTDADEEAQTKLEDASQFMLDAYPACTRKSANTRKRIVCAVVRRAMEGEAAIDDALMVGFAEVDTTTGPFGDRMKPLNPHGDFYLTEQEQRSLGLGKGRRQQAFQVNMLAVDDAQNQ